MSVDSIKEAVFNDHQSVFTRRVYEKQLQHKMDQSFITNEKFQASSERVETWASLPLRTIYRINAIKTKTFEKNGVGNKSKYAVLSSREGEVRHVFITSVIEKELEKYNVDTDELYIQSFGLRKNANGTRSYYDFDVVKC